MNIINKIQADIKQAMKDKNTQKKNALRALLAECQEFEKVNKKEIEAKEFINILLKQLKQIRESIEAFEKGGREELALEAHRQYEALTCYAPKQYTEEEVAEVVKNALKETEHIKPISDNKYSASLIRRLLPLFSDQIDKPMIMRVISSFIE